MEAQMNSYQPQEGSNGAKAIRALRAGPMSVPELARLIGHDSRTIYPALHRPIQEGLIVKCKNADDLMHFALAEHDLPEGFTAYETRVVGAGISTTLGKGMPVDPGDPFGLVAKKNGVSNHTPKHQELKSDEVLAINSKVEPKVPAASPAPAPAATVAAKTVSTPAARPVQGQVNKLEIPLLKNEKPIAPLPRTKSSDHFACALFSTGELLIEEDYNSIKLSPEKYAALQAYMARFKDLT